MEIKYKRESDPTWQNTGSGVSAKDNSDSVSEFQAKRPKTLDEIQNGVYSKRRKEEAEEAERRRIIEQQKELRKKALLDEAEIEAQLRQIEAMNDETSDSDFPESINPDNTKEEEIPVVQPEEKSKFQKITDTILTTVRKHKILSSICAVLIIILIAVISIANHYLNKINYVPTDQAPSQVYVSQGIEPTTEELKIITLSTGETVDVTGLTRNADGTYNLPDGRRFNADGTIWNLDGTVVFYDGSYLMPDGTAVLPNGTAFYPDFTLVFPNGTSYKNTGVKSDKEGYIYFRNGVTAHLTAFEINTEGYCNSKETKLKNLKYTAEGTWSIFNNDTSNVVVKNEENNGNNVTPLTGPAGVTNGNAAVDDEEGFDKALAESKEKLVMGDESIERNSHNKEIWYSDDIMNILLMGIDNGSVNYPYGRSDSMIILSVNKKTHNVKMISLSRAVYAKIQGYENTRLNHAHGYGGASLAIDSIERNYKIRIDRYVETGFETFKKIIDVLGGVSIDLTSAEAKALKTKIKQNGLTYNGAGKYNLNGNLALEYVRLRKIDSDKERTGRQRKILMSIANKAKNSNIFQLNSLANNILPLITTNMSKSEIVSQLANANTYLNGKIDQYVVPHGSYPLVMIGQFEVLTIDWEKEVKYIHNLLYSDVTPKYYTKN